MTQAAPMRCLVTGAAGFLAKSLVRQLLAAGHEVRGLVRDPAAGESVRHALTAADAVRFGVVVGDIVRTEDCARAVEGCDVIFHVAAQTTGPLPPMVVTNVVGTRRLIAASAAAGVKRFVVVSSIGVYDTRGVREAVDEDTPLDPNPQWRDAYTFSKVAEEHAAREDAARLALPLVIVRPGVIVGQSRGSLSARVGLKLGRWVLNVGGGRKLPYTHVDNCARALMLAGITPGVEGMAFNVIDDDAPTANQVLRAYRRAGRGLRPIRVPYPLMKMLGIANAWYHRKSTGQLPAVVTPYKVSAMWRCLRYSNARAKSVLGWKPTPQPLATE